MSVSTSDLAELQASVVWTDDDAAALRRAGEILVPNTDEILEVWYRFVGANPHLLATFVGTDGPPDAAHLADVRARFGQWIADVCTRDYDEAWLRHRERDGVASASDNVPLRHLIALIVPITVTVREFLAAGDADPSDVDAMYHAWFKVVTLSVALWARPYGADLW